MWKPNDRLGPGFLMPRVQVIQPNGSLVLLEQEFSEARAKNGNDTCNEIFHLTSSNLDAC
jgi:hypothetical protein